jgi:putative hydrolase of the HAD superfamily
VLFDATGTLIELREGVGETYARVASRHGVALPAWRLEDGFRRIVASRPPRVFPDSAPEDVPAHERDWWRDVVRDTFRATDQTVRFDDFDAFFDELFSGYAKASAWRLRTGARAALTRLRGQGIRLGIVSDFDYRLTELLEALEVAEFFDCVILAGALGVGKPDRRLFEAALQALESDAEHAVYVGDDPERDLAGARAIGLFEVDVKSLASLAELPARLATLGAPGAVPERAETENAETENLPETR